jgi:hypothetical protein
MVTIKDVTNGKIFDISLENLYNNL